MQSNTLWFHRSLTTEDTPVNAEQPSTLKGIGTFGGKLLKSNGAIKVLLAGGSFAAWSAMFTWQLALLIISAIFIHESGHVWAMRKVGIPTKGFYFIPLLGGAAVATGNAKTEWDHVCVVLMGPLFGLVNTLVLLGIFVVTHNPLWAEAASLVALFNMFNLLPIHPLDGGRLLKSITRWLHVDARFYVMAIGAILCGVMLLKFQNPLFGFLLLIGVCELYAAWKESNNRSGHHQLARWMRNITTDESILAACEDHETLVKVSIGVYHHRESQGINLTLQPEDLPEEVPGLSLPTVLGTILVYWNLVVMLLWIITNLSGIPEASGVLTIP